MIRLQIRLTDDQAEKAKQAASKMGISMAEFVRRALNDALAKNDKASARQRARRVIGCVKSGTTDLSTEHDRYLQEAYLEQLCTCD